MVIQIEIDSEALEPLYKYCRKTPAEVPLVMQRILRDWVKMTARRWYKDKILIPRMPEIPESRMTSVGINTDIGNLYKNTIKIMNAKFGAELIHEGKLASLLLASFVKVYNLKEVAKTSRLKWGTG